ncbi:protein disulfide isomerase (PDI) protein [Mortierella hygrophila]|uniref:protein disulfide-isomerase n=1 Tax=Mortierella hygrophila TaxID=979708 RepID=A0A9P6F5G0_9FUNG|nr:protein disulfide isomerase (PDI) protein [Mortierella hygrophila]
MKHSLTTIALGALLLSQSVLAGLYSSKDNVIDVTPKNFQAEVMDSNHVVMVEFYAPWCGHCKNLVPQYKAAAKNLKGIAKMAAIDCDDDKNKPLCSQYGIQGFPTIKIFPANRKGGVKYPKDYQGERSAKAIVSELVKMLPNDVQLLSANPTSEKIINIDEFAADTSSPRAVLFTKKLTTSNMYKGLATEFKDKMVVAEMRAPSDDILAKYNIQNLPTLIVFPKGSQESTTFSGELKHEPISEFLSEYAGSAKKGGSAKSSPADSSATPAPKPVVVEFNPNIDQVKTQEEFKKLCLNKDRGNCAIAFLIVEPEYEESVKMHEENLEMLRQVKKKAHEAGKGIDVMWMDALDKRVVALKEKFRVSEDIPGLLLINPGRKAYVPFIGEFDVQGIEHWLSDATSGRARAIAYNFEATLDANKPVKDEL